MAAEQLRRENVSDERKIVVEKDRVPRMASRFEALAEKAKGSDVHEEAREGHEELPPHQFESLAGEIGGVEFASIGEGEALGEKEGDRRRDDKSTADEERNANIGTQKQAEAEKKSQGCEVRQTAQQNSMEAIKAAEERYEGMQTGTQRVSERAGDFKNTALEKGQQGYQATKERVSGAAKTAVEHIVPVAHQAKDYTMQKMVEAKDVIESAGQSAAQYASEKAPQVKNSAVDTSENAASYVQEKAASAKDLTVESGKGAVGYVGKVAEEVKDKTKVAGWGTAHFTLEKTAEATKAVASVAAEVGGYTGEKAVQLKDVVAGAGQKVVHYAGDKLAAAKDVAVSTEESAAEYAARKKAEAQREHEAKKESGANKGGEGGRGFAGDTKQGGMQKETMQPDQEGGEVAQSITKTIAKPAVTDQQKGQEGTYQEEESQRQQKIPEGTDQEEENQQQQQQQHREGGGVLHVIGETIVEIGQTTKDMLVGQGKPQMYEGDESEEK